VFTVEFASGMRYAEVADSWEGNTDDTFCAFAVAIASTRAEARALRKALKIRAVSAEELTKKDTAKIVRQISASKASSDGDYNDQNRMSDAQYNFIDVKCKQLNINGNKLFKLLSLDNHKKVSKKSASDVIDKLNDFQRDKSLITEDLLGYEQEWRN
jgi:Asp-tRNA(Asn)/Glu-tRNA(Gln) amidotransferase B subunit